MKKKHFIIPLLLVASVSGNAQSIGPSTLNAAGGWAPIGGNEFEWSIGEMTMVTTFTASNVIVTQGVLQPAAGSTGVPHNPSVVSQMSVFPNPASSVVNFRYTAGQAGKLNYRLTDITGKVLLNRDAMTVQGNNEYLVDLTDLACATYMLQIMLTTGTGTPEDFTYKIQKIK